jgi:DNA polymerase I-like protein with 3'-5' exonuclease and polymerase domains
MLAKDSETTGVDSHHGAMPYLLSLYDGAGPPLLWEGRVDPLTRKVFWDPEDVAEYRRRTEEADELGYQNAKFDLSMERLLGIEPDFSKLIHDSLISGHLLGSNHDHDLTSMAYEYLGVNIQPYETALEIATKQARTICGRKFPEWRIAKEGLPEMPSAKAKTWKYDSWLPKALAEELEYPDDHPWFRVHEEYAATDPVVTYDLIACHRTMLEERGLYPIYLERLKLIQVIYGIEQAGVSINLDRMRELRADYERESGLCSRKMRSIAGRRGYELILPKSGNNKSLVNFVFRELGLPAVAWSEKTGEPSLDKGVLEHYAATLEPGPARDFVMLLRRKRKRDTSIGFLESYDKFGVRNGSVG